MIYNNQPPGASGTQNLGFPMRNRTKILRERMRVTIWRDQKQNKIDQSPTPLCPSIPSHLAYEGLCGHTRESSTVRGWGKWEESLSVQEFLGVIVSFPLL